jgi:hypothetical protein
MMAAGKPQGMRTGDGASECGRELGPGAHLRPELAAFLM